MLCRSAGSIVAVVAVVAVVAACSGKAEPPRPEPLARVPVDAAPDGISTIAGWDPQSGMHLDDDVPGQQPVAHANRPGRPIEIILRSNPTGAKVHVDGVPYGLTPKVWVGDTGAEHEFTFVLEGHALARYRFFPVTSGVVHARLDPVAVEGDAGVPPPPEVVPPQVAPPPTLLTPDARIPSVHPPDGAPPVAIDAATTAPTAPAVPVVPVAVPVVVPVVVPVGPQP